MGRSGGTLQWQDANAKVFQLAEGANEVHLILDGLRTVCDQLETGPGQEFKKTHTHKGMWLARVDSTGIQMQPKMWTFSCTSFATTMKN